MDHPVAVGAEQRQVTNPLESLTALMQRLDVMALDVAWGAPALPRLAIDKFAEATHAGLHLEKIQKSKDDRIRTIREKHQAPVTSEDLSGI
jgi:hypothetical protein